LEKNEIMKKFMIVTMVLVAVFLSAMIAPTFAAAPKVLDEAWFVIPMFVSSTGSTPLPSFIPDRVWTSDGGTVLHSMGTSISTYIARSPPGAPGTVRIGTMTATSNFVFDTITQSGTLNMKISITLTDASNKDFPQPYGTGTFEGTLVAEITSLSPYATAVTGPLPGNGQGYFVATHGTGDFANAKLEGDVTLEPGTAQVTKGPFITIEYIFFGHHINHDYNDGSITFHNPGKAK
jgi:hypothetical protein